MERKGWFKIDGVQDGDRTIEQQLIGLESALAEADGATVLDLGCAEGLIARKFAKAGAKVLGVEILRENVDEAVRQCEGYRVKVAHDNVELFLDGEHEHDIVLALSVLHKLRRPSDAARRIGQIARSMVVIRLPPEMRGFVLDSRSGNVRHEVTQPLNEVGWKLVAEVKGPLEEWTGYYRPA